MATTMPMMLPSSSALFRIALVILFWALFRLGAYLPQIHHYHPLVTDLPPVVQLHILRHLSRSDRNSFAMAFPWWCWLVHAHSNELPEYATQAEQARIEEEARNKRRRLHRILLPIIDLSNFLTPALALFDVVVDALAFCRNLQFAVTGLFIHLHLLTPDSTNLVPIRIICLFLYDPSSSSATHLFLLRLQYVYFAITLSLCTFYLIFALHYGSLLPPNPQPNSFGSSVWLYIFSGCIVHFSTKAVTLISNNPWYLFLLQLVSILYQLVRYWKDITFPTGMEFV